MKRRKHRALSLARDAACYAAVIGNYKKTIFLRYRHLAPIEHFFNSFAVRVQNVIAIRLCVPMDKIQNLFI